MVEATPKPKVGFFEPVKTTTPAVKKAPAKGTGIASTVLETLKGLPQATFDIYSPIFKPVLDRTSFEPVLGKQKPFAEQVKSDPLGVATSFSNFGAGARIGKAIGKAAEPVAEGIFDAAKYVAENVAKREAARGPSMGFRGKVSEFWKEFKSSLVDSNSPIEDTLARTLRTNQMTLRPTEDITNQIDRVLRAPTIAGQFVKDKGLENIIRNVDSLENLEEYLIARHAIDVDTAGFATGRSLDLDQKLVASFKDKYEETAKGVTEYSRRLLDYSVDAGLVSPELATKLKEVYPNYVPLNRVFSELEQEGTSFATPRGVANLTRQTIVQKLEGSEREVESPIISLLSKTYDTFLQGERNKAARMLAGYEKLPGNPFQLTEIKPSSKKDAAMGTISFLDNGVKRTFQTTKDIEAAAKSLNPQTLNIMGRILAFPVRIARLGITGVNVPFIISNIARDQVTAFINSRKGLQTSVANPKVYLTALFQAVGHGKLYDEIVRAGGMGTAFDIAREQAPKTVASLRSKHSVPERAAFLVKNPGELLRAVENIVARAEEFTRIKQYAGTKDALLREGSGEADAIAGAARAAREDTVNFLRRGDWGTVLNSALLYFNAGIQGTRTLLRGLRERPASTATKIAVSTFTPVAITTAWNIDDEKRREAYADIADYEKENNLIIIPPNPTKDADGKWNVIKIPLSPEIIKLSALPRRAMEQAHGLDPVRFGEIARALLGSIQPIDPTMKGAVNALTPQAVKGTIEGQTNTNLFTGLPIVPRKLENLPPEAQVKENTSGSARILGGLTGTSPLKVENFIRSTAGGVGSQTINMVDNLLAKGGVIPEEQIGGESIAKNVLRRLGKASGGEIERKAIDDILEAVGEQDLEKFRLNSQAEQRYNALKELPKEEANARFAEIVKENRPLAEQMKKIAEAEKLGLTASERFLLQLNVTNGARAKYIYKLLKQMESKEEKNAYVKGLIDKDIVSTNVYAQLRELIKRDQ